VDFPTVDYLSSAFLIFIKILLRIRPFLDFGPSSGILKNAKERGV
jgi:hypothetical protein